MRLHPQPSLALVSLVLPSLAAAVGFDCANVRVDGVHFDLSPLGGVHEIWHVEEFDDYILNTTWVLNICGILGKKSIRGDLRCGTSMNGRLVLLPWFYLQIIILIVWLAVCSVRLRGEDYPRRG